MNKKTTLRLRAMLYADMPPDISDEHRAQMWTIVKRAYNTLSKTDRHPDRLHAALARAMTAMGPKLTS